MNSEPIYVVSDSHAHQVAGEGCSSCACSVPANQCSMEVNAVSYCIQTCQQPAETNYLSMEPISVEVSSMNAAKANPQLCPIVPSPQYYSGPIKMSVQPDVSYSAPISMGVQPPPLPYSTPISMGVQPPRQPYTAPISMGVQPPPPPVYIRPKPSSFPSSQCPSAAGVTPQYPGHPQYSSSFLPPGAAISRYLPPGYPNTVQCPCCNGSLTVPLGAFHFLCPCGQLLVNPYMKSGYVPPH